jgi:hypothetical protein
MGRFRSITAVNMHALASRYRLAEQLLQQPVTIVAVAFFKLVKVCPGHH